MLRWRQGRISSLPERGSLVVSLRRQWLGENMTGESESFPKMGLLQVGRHVLKERYRAFEEHPGGLTGCVASAHETKAGE
jgi:hypothetical protein